MRSASIVYYAAFSSTLSTTILVSTAAAAAVAANDTHTYEAYPVNIYTNVYLGVFATGCLDTMRRLTWQYSICTSYSIWRCDVALCPFPRSVQQLWRAYTYGQQEC
eukprot:9552-Heterococcus_DN1.PRE.2